MRGRGRLQWPVLGGFGELEQRRRRPTGSWSARHGQSGLGSLRGSLGPARKRKNTTLVVGAVLGATGSGSGTGERGQGDLGRWPGCRVREEEDDWHMAVALAGSSYSPNFLFSIC
ncbi:hypothetical protein RJT34_14014 [Clitoria ternatea]|uniref:Uncharacterized protein n=1 Tax=Clitoria ternatea TaxID=43366 RepID=A0AAN9JPZ6_CLITE